MNILSNSFCHFHIINILNYKEKKRNVQIQKELKWKSKTFVNNLNISLGRKRFYFRKKSVFDLDLLEITSEKLEWLTIAF